MNNTVNILNMSVLQQLTKVVCKAGKNFFFNSSSIWIKDGCGAIFQVCYPELDTEMTTSSQPSPEPNNTIYYITISCQEVPFVCGKKEHKQLEILDGMNNTVNIINMTVLRQLTKVVCKAGKNFFFNSSSISIKNGCGAIFQVCYPELVTKINVPSSRRPEENKTTIFVTTPEVETTPLVETTLEVETTLLVETTLEVETTLPVETTLEVETNPSVEMTPEIETNQPVVTTPEVETTPLTLTTQKIGINEPLCQRLTLNAPARGNAIYTFTSNNNNPLLVVSMELQEQFSTVQCLEWFNYYFEGNTVLAKSGCWGQFEVCYLENVTLAPLFLEEPPGQSCRFITLASIRSRPVLRDITDAQGQNVTLRSMTVARQLSQTPCLFGPTFVFTIGGPTVLVRNGCIGTFQICSDAKDVTYTASEGEVCDREVILHSHISEPDDFNLTDSMRNPLTVRALVLEKEISEIRCVAGHSFFFEGSILQAIDGCKGYFIICYTSGHLTVKPTMAVTTSVTRRDNQKCQRVKLKSRRMHPVNKSFYDAEGNPASITSVTIVEQISKMKCIKGVSFKVSQYRLQASLGCQAVFDVCLDTADEKITTPTSTSVTRRDNQKCQRVELKSHWTHPVDKAFYDAEGNPTSIASVTIVEEISNNRCVEGETFKVSQYLLRASHGCQAVFDVCLDTADEKITTPASTSGNNQKCEQVQLMSSSTLPVKKTFIDAAGYPIPIKSVRVLKPLSRTECLQGDTFTVYPYGLRVFGGCRAVFEICLGQGIKELTTSAPPTDEECMKLNVDSSGPRKLKVVKIVDRNKRPARVTRVEVDHQITDVACVEGETFMFEHSNVRATDGCGAVFNVCYEIETFSNPEEECVDVTLRSREHMTKAADIRDKNQNLVNILSVKVLKQLSYSPCIHLETYSYKGCTLKASDGCSAVFKVCYEKDSRVKNAS